MTEREVREMTALRNTGKEYKEIAYTFSMSAHVVNRWIRNYRTYGSSLFSDYPTPVIAADYSEELAD